MAMNLKKIYSIIYCSIILKCIEAYNDINNSIVNGGASSALTMGTDAKRLQDPKPRNYYFMSTDDLFDGEHEIRLSLWGVKARQTSVGPKEGSQGGLILREVSNGRQILNMVLTGLSEPYTLAECTFEREPVRVNAFLKSVIRDSEDAQLIDQGLLNMNAAHNWTRSAYKVVSSIRDVPEELRELMLFKRLKKQCRGHIRKVKELRRRQAKNNMYQIGNEEMTENANEDRNINLQESNKGLKTTEKIGMDQEDSITQSTSSDKKLSRARRSLNDFFILPGTLWCGNQHRAKSTYDLSGHFDADACCRVHDFCPYNIGGVSSKYGVFNRNLVTMSHCGCDTRFRTCLKSSNTGAAHLVGKIFFDYVRTECFTFVKKNVCRRRSWNGKCLRYRRERRAVIRNPMPWTR